jgi:hypothetical protein
MSELIKEKYLRYADRCVQAANSAPSAEDRLQYLEMAQAWRTLADKSDVVDNLLMEARQNNLLPDKPQIN